MFHSTQLALDAAVLLTVVESCALSPSTADVLQASYSFTAAAYTRCLCQRLDMAAGILLLIVCTPACCKWKVSTCCMSWRDDTVPAVAV